jgi:hypothetical protein
VVICVCIVIIEWRMLGVDRLENADAAVRTKLSKRQELREMTLQLLKVRRLHLSLSLHSRRTHE